MRSSSASDRSFGSQITPPLAPPNGMLTTAHFQVIQAASARTSPSFTSCGSKSIRQVSDSARWHGRFRRRFRLLYYHRPSANEPDGNAIGDPTSSAAVRRHGAGLVFRIENMSAQREIPDIPELA